MALTTEEKAQLDKLRQDLLSRTGPAAEKLEKAINEVDLTGISANDLKSLSDAKFTIGLNFNLIDTSGESTGGKFTTTHMNEIAPGAIGVDVLKSKLSNQSMLQGRVTDIVDTQSGVMAVNNEIKLNSDIEDVVESKSKSQGINLQLVNRATNVDAQQVAKKEIKSRFVR